MSDMTLLDTSLQEHPATRAWLSLHPQQSLPRHIVELKSARQKSAVYRLEGVGPHGSAVVAKRCASSTASVERTVYTEVLPHVPYPTLQFFGWVDEPDGEAGWIFVEDAGGIPYSHSDPEHRILGAEWLATLHTSAERLQGSVVLPVRGPNYHFDNMRLAYVALRAGVSNQTLPNSSVELLELMLLHVQAIESQWDSFSAQGTGLPITIVHGGFYGKNVHVRESDGRQIVYAFDWESAGWAVPVLDLAHEDIAEYWPRVQAYWPTLTMGALEEVVVLGRILWVLKAISGEAKSLAGSWTMKVIEKMAYYNRELEACMHKLGWVR